MDGSKRAAAPPGIHVGGADGTSVEGSFRVTRPGGALLSRDS